MTQSGRTTSDGGLYLGPDAASRLRTSSVDRGRASGLADDAAWSTSDAVDLALVDTHCHLDAEAFADDATTDILGRARRAGVTRLVTIGTDLESSTRAVRLARHHHEIWATVGIDPNDLPVDGSPLTAAMLAAVEDLTRQPRVVAIGEIGLDYYWNRTSHEVQRAAFEAQLGLAERVGLPVVIHSRDADGDVEAVLAAWAGGHPWGGGGRTGDDAAGGGAKGDGDGVGGGDRVGGGGQARGPAPTGRGGTMGGGRPLGVLHCFAGDVALAERYVGLGFLISLSGIVTFKSNAQTHAVARELPLEALVLETDAPYLAPHPHRGRRNEPAYVRLIAEHVAALRGEDAADVARATTANAARLFGWDDAGAAA